MFLKTSWLAQTPPPDKASRLLNHGCPVLYLKSPDVRFKTPLSNLQPQTLSQLLLLSDGDSALLHRAYRCQLRFGNFGNNHKNETDIEQEGDRVSVISTFEKLWLV